MTPSVHNVLTVRASAADVSRILARLPAVAAGSPGGAGGAVRALQVRVGLTALGRIKKAFVVKARGGVDEAGESWKPLSKHTVAYTRRHPGVPKRRKFWDTHPSYTLTDKRRSEWWSLYRRFKARYRGNKSHAAAVAWLILRQRYPGIRTLMNKYGNTQVEILRDTGVLLNSLSPGADADAGLPSPPRQQNQVFRTLPGAVILGTNRRGAAANHKGISGRLPQRRLWPPPSSWPSAWWSELLDQARKGVVEIIRNLLGRP